MYISNDICDYDVISIEPNGETMALLLAEENKVDLTLLVITRRGGSSTEFSKRESTLASL